MLHILFWFTQAEVHAIQLLSASGYVTKSCSDFSVGLFPESPGISRKQLDYVLEISIALKSFVIIFFR